VTIPAIEVSSVPALTADQMREVDRKMIEDLGIELIQMMENAGRSLAELVIQKSGPSSVTVLAGSGGNGGGGMAAARHLHNRGVAVRLTLAGPIDGLSAAARHQYEILVRMGVETTVDPEPGEIVIDALIGYSLRGAPRGRTADLIRWANLQEAVISLDTPSGLDVTTGQALDPCIQAVATMTLALPKIGLLDNLAVGALYLADISVPPSVHAALGSDVGHLFGEAPLVRLT
jgi:NAD(P)H-hydrate epimerase